MTSDRKWTRPDDYVPEKDIDIIIIQDIINEDKAFAEVVLEVGELLKKRVATTEDALDVLGYLITSLGATTLKRRDDAHRWKFAKAVSTAIYIGIERMWKESPRN